MPLLLLLYLGKILSYNMLYTVYSNIYNIKVYDNRMVEMWHERKLNDCLAELYSHLLFIKYKV